MSSFHIAVSACSGESGRNAQLSHGSRSEADWSEGSQIRALSSGSHQAIRANGELAPIEFDVMIGMQVHPRALALRAAIGGAGDCLVGFGRAPRAPVRRTADFEPHRHFHPQNREAKVRCRGVHHTREHVVVTATQKNTRTRLCSIA
jgi:hypothetical protein